jgi:rod shape determining protein RodA
MLGVTLVDYRRFRELVPLIYAGAIALLVLVISPLGSERKGAQRWFELGGFQLQPAEIAKLAVILAIAAVLAQFEQEIDLRRLLIVLAVPGLPFVLFMLQPDLGSALVFVAVSMGTLLIGGVQTRHIVALTIVGLIGVGVVLSSGMLEEYQRCRLTSFLDRQDESCEGGAYNQDQSLVAIGSGSVLGKGLFQGTQTRLDIVPEQHTDFIFTAVGEELGFIGSATLLALLSIIAWRIWRTAQLARDPFGTLVCVGVLCMFVFQVFENMGMAMGIMPVTGIPLPFMSYGGSATLAVVHRRGPGPQHPHAPLQLTPAPRPEGGAWTCSGQAGRWCPAGSGRPAAVVGALRPQADRGSGQPRRAPGSAVSWSMPRTGEAGPGQRAVPGSGGASGAGAGQHGPAPVPRGQLVPGEPEGLVAGSGRLRVTALVPLEVLDPGVPRPPSASSTSRHSSMTPSTRRAPALAPGERRLPPHRRDLGLLDQPPQQPLELGLRGEVPGPEALECRSQRSQVAAATGASTQYRSRTASSTAGLRLARAGQRHPQPLLRDHLREVDEHLPDA